MVIVDLTNEDKPIVTFSPVDDVKTVIVISESEDSSLEVSDDEEHTSFEELPDIGEIYAGSKTSVDKFISTLGSGIEDGDRERLHGNIEDSDRERVHGNTDELLEFEMSAMWMKSLKPKVFKRFIQDTGLPQGYSRDETASHFLSLVRQGVRGNHRYIVSIDIGSQNFAWSVYDRYLGCLIEWDKATIKADKIRPLKYAVKLHSILDQITKCKPSEEFLFLVEMQPLPSRNSLYGCIENLIIETAIHSSVSNSIEVNPAMVTSYRKRKLKEIENELDDTEKSLIEASIKKIRKKQAVVLMKKLLSKGSLDFEHADIAKRFHECNKKDDLADCLIQLLYFLDSTTEAGKWLAQYQDWFNNEYSSSKAN